MTKERNVSTTKNESCILVEDDSIVAADRSINPRIELESHETKSAIVFYGNEQKLPKLL